MALGNFAEGFWVKADFLYEDRRNQLDSYSELEARVLPLSRRIMKVVKWTYYYYGKLITHLVSVLSRNNTNNDQLYFFHADKLSREKLEFSFLLAVW